VKSMNPSAAVVAVAEPARPSGIVCSQHQLDRPIRLKDCIYIARCTLATDD
jgi:hypothetical protein